MTSFQSCHRYYVTDKRYQNNISLSKESLFFYTKLSGFVYLFIIIFFFYIKFNHLSVLWYVISHQIYIFCCHPCYGEWSNRIDSKHFLNYSSGIRKIKI